MVKNICNGSTTGSQASGSTKGTDAAALAKKKPHHNYQFIDIAKRIDVIYDNFVHDQQPMDISHQRQLKYNTIRCILKNFYQHGRVNVKKKMSGYLKGDKQHQRTSEATAPAADPNP